VPTRSDPVAGHPPNVGTARAAVGRPAARYGYRRFVSATERATNVSSTSMSTSAKRLT
jgi:hypothetical protein